MEFEREGEKCGMINMLEQVRKFYNSNWPSNTPFDVILVPLPKENQSSSHGESIGKTQIVELISSNIFADHSVVVFHELCHSLWERKILSSKLKNVFQKYNFDDSYDVFNESLATALGDGWFHQTTYPQARPTEIWYGEEIIDHFAHGLVPLVRKYLDTGRVLDTDFEKCASEIFSEKCPQASRMISKCQALHIVADVDENSGMSEFTDKILKLLPNIRRLQGEALYSEDFSKRRICKFGEFRRIVLLSDSEIETLKDRLASAVLDKLKTRKEEAISLLINKSEVTFCFGENFEKQKEVALRVIKKKYWPDPVH